MSLNPMSSISKHKSSLCPTFVHLFILAAVPDANIVSSTATVVKPLEMGLLFLSTSMQVYLLSATFKVTTKTCTTTLPPSLADLSGVFDTPKLKCPPDRGSSDCVTGGLAPTYSTTNPSFSSNLQYPLKNITEPSFKSNGSNNRNPPRPMVYPRAIPTRSSSALSTLSTLSTPPLTPDDGDDSDAGSIEPPHDSQAEKDALDFLMNLFPNQGLQALPHAKRVSVSTPNMGPAFDGVVLELPGKPRTLYVDGKSAQSVSFRESIVALLDLADERLECSALAIVLERSVPNLGALLHSLMYVGGTVVTKPVFSLNPSYILVGLEI